MLLNNDKKQKMRLKAEEKCQICREGEQSGEENKWDTPQVVSDREVSEDLL